MHCSAFVKKDRKITHEVSSTRSHYSNQHMSGKSTESILLCMVNTQPNARGPFFYVQESLDMLFRSSQREMATDLK